VLYVFSFVSGFKFERLLETVATCIDVPVLAVALGICV